jgi:hypothetical protein
MKTVTNIVFIAASTFLVSGLTTGVNDLVQGVSFAVALVFGGPSTTGGDLAANRLLQGQPSRCAGDHRDNTETSIT